MASVTPVVRDATTGLLRNMQAGEQISAAVAFADTRQATNGESATTITGGMPVVMGSNGKLTRAVGSALATARVSGLVYDASIAAAASGNYIVAGTLSQATGNWDAITGQSGGLTPGSDYFLDPANAGKITATPPVAAGTVLVKVGTAQSATDMEVTIRDPFVN